jgi:TRAP-type transport system small permease protein
MQETFSGVSAILQALFAGESWALSQAVRDPALFWLVGVALLPAAFVLMLVFRKVRLLDEYLEPTAMFLMYMAMATIIFIEVIRRFFFNVQAPWSTSLPAYLFLLLTWVGCAYNVKLRSHLSFGEVRAMMSPSGKLALSFLDAILWYVMAVVVMVATLRLTVSSAANFQLLLGTNDIMRWWFYICVPIAWLILYARVIENLAEDVRNYREDREFGLTNDLARE